MEEVPAPDSDVLRCCTSVLRKQEAKGRSKYNADLDGNKLSILEALHHAQEEAADLLMYLVSLEKALERKEASNV